jgi:transcriptional regulator with XRE-family HTH domain
MAVTASNMMDDQLGLSPKVLRRRLGRRARDIRLSATRTQASIARAAGVSLPTLQRFESGVNVSLDVLVRVAIVLGAEVALSELFPLPDPRTIDELIAQRKLPRRGRAR